MSENKEMLEATVTGLQEKIASLQNDLKTKQQESKVHGQKPVKQTSGKEKSARVYYP